MVRFLCASAFLCTLWGCAAPPVATLPADQLWQDAAFQYNPALVEETPQTLFAVDQSIIFELRAHTGRVMSTERRLNDLLTLLYGEQGIRLGYAAGHSTSAIETWKRKQGDCMSLTILTYAVAKALDIRAVMQEVIVAPVFDRRDGAEYVSHHVNVLIPTNATIVIDKQVIDSGGIVVDFQPQSGARSRGRELTEDQIVARFYNNRATEYLTHKQDELAYAYYRAAIAADVHYGPAYSNLAQLYYRRGLQKSAEQLLWHAIALDKVSDAPMRNLHTLLMAQGRDQEAREVGVMMERLKNQDPYHWLGTGVEALQKGNTRSAISALERAETLAIGFQEIHFYLAIAYARNGERDKAARQISALDAINHNDPSIALLNKKLQNMGAKSAFF